MKNHGELAEQAAKNLADSLNSFGNGPEIEIFVETMLKEHRTLQQSSFKAILRLIQRWAELESSGRYDGRNEFTVKTCRKLIETLEKEDVIFDGRIGVPFI